MTSRGEKREGAVGAGEVEVVRTPSGFTMRGAVSSPEFDLPEAIGPEAPRPVQLAVLHEVVGLKLREIADAVSVTEQSVRNWKKQDSPNRPPAYDDLRAVVELILRSGTADPQVIGVWLRSRNRGLGYERPLEMIKAGEFRRVMEVAESFISLSPAAAPEGEGGEAARPQAKPAGLDRTPASDQVRATTRTYS